MGKAGKHSGFCFTLNNWSVEQHNELLDLFQSGYFGYLIMGKETAPSTGTPHLQGFMWTSEPKQLAVLKKKFKGMWIAVPGPDKGPTYWQTYCTKQDVDATILGNPPSEEEFKAQTPKGQGKRSDLLAVKRAIDEGKNCEELMGDDEHFGTFAQHSKYFNSYQAYKRRRTSFNPPQVTVYYGGTGTNKTRRVYEDVDNLEELHKWEPQHGQWFDGYAGQKTVLLDEYRGQLPYGMLLSMLDGYPNTKVQIKGGMVHWSPEVIYITSPTHPKEWYPNLTANDKIEQLLRRITDIVCTDR